MVLIGLVARGWLRRTSTRGGLSPFLASRRLVRRQDLVQLVLPLLLATAMATFAASAWKVADDWRVSKAAASVGAPAVYFTDTSPSRLQWVTQQADPEGLYLAAAVPPWPRTVDGGRVGLVDASRFARVAAWDEHWGTSGAQEVQDWLSPTGDKGPITFSGTHVQVELTDISLEGELNLPLQLWLRYVPASTGEERLAQLGDLPKKKGSVTIDGFVSECEDGCSLQQLFLAGSSSSVTDAAGRITIASIAADGDDAGDWRLDDADAWRPARPFGESGSSPVSLDTVAGGLELRLIGDPAVVRLTTTDVPALPPVVATDTTLLDPVEGESAEAVGGASVLGARTPMELTGQAKALPLVGSNGGLSDLTAALREYGDTSTEVPISELLVAADTPASVLAEVRELGIPLNDRRTEGEELDAAALRRLLAGLAGVPAGRRADAGARVPGRARPGRGAAALAVLRGGGAAGGRRTPPRPASRHRRRVRRAARHGRRRRCPRRDRVAAARAPVARHRHHRRVRPGGRLQPALAGDGWRARPGDDRRAGDRAVDLAPYGQAGHPRDAAASGCAVVTAAG